MYNLFEPNKNLNQSELLAFQSFPSNYQFPPNYSLTKIASLLGNSVNVEVIKYFVKKNYGQNFALTYVDLFSGIGGFHLALLGDCGVCVLAVDINKSCQTVYQLNFPTTPFLFGDINAKKVQQAIGQQEFQLLSAGFPCQSFSQAGPKSGVSPELDSLVKIIQKKQPPYILLETVPHFLTTPGLNKLVKALLGYACNYEILNPRDLGIKQNRPRLFVWGERK